MVCGERDVVCRMPVFGGNLDHKGEVEELVDGGNDISAIWHCEGAILFAISRYEDCLYLE